jgi:hypothetical protein
MRAGGTASKRRGIGVLLTLAMLACAIFWTPVAMASTFTWSGKASSSVDGWSDMANWAGDTAPSSLSTVSLSFPLLGSGCEVAKPSEACYESDEDISGLTAESIEVSDGGEYEIEGGDGVTLGSGGLTSLPEGTSFGYAVLGLPLTLGATQTWHLAGSSRESLANHLFLLEGNVSGENSELTVDAEDSVEFAIGAQVDVGPVKIEGADASGNRDANAIVGLGEGGSINASDGEPVRLSHVYFFGSGRIGALSTEAATLAIGSEQEEPGKLEAASASFNSATTTEFEAHGTGSEAGADYSQLVSSGPVSLNSALLAMFVPKLEGEACSSLPVGQTYTLVSTTGELLGSFSNAPEEGEIPVTFSSACGSMPAQKLQISYSLSGTTKTVSATVAGAVSSTTGLSVSPEAPVTDQPVTLTATVSAGGGLEPTGTVSFEGNGSVLPGCSGEPVVLRGSTYMATCHSSLLASSSPDSLSASYLPTAGIHVLGSKSNPQIVKVKLASTNTTLSASSLTSSVGQQVVYTATVAQSIAPTLSGPTGSVLFYDGKELISSCASSTLAVGVGSSTATCGVTYEAAGEHTVTAGYLGDPNFLTSSSGVASVSITQSGSPGGEHDTEAEGDGKTGSSHQQDHLKLLGRTLKLKGDVTAANLRCEGDERCEGTVELSEQVSVRVHGKEHRHAVVIGGTHYSISAGRKSTIHIELDAAGRAALKQARSHLVATMTIESPKTALGKVDIER